jgi:hypothetical protein
MHGYERLSPSSNGGDDAQVFPDCCCSFVCDGGSCRAGRHCGQYRCQGSRSEPAVVGAASRRQRFRGKTSSHGSAENGNAKTDDDAEADGHAERDAATPDTHAPPFRTSQFQTKAALRVSLVWLPQSNERPFGSRFARRGRRKLARDR